MRINHKAVQLYKNTTDKVCATLEKFKTVFLVALLSLPLNTTAVDADQAVEQIKSQLTNKAIDTTEGYIGGRLNEFFNSFGEGKTSISIEGIESKKPNYSIDTIQPLGEFNSEIYKLTFVQGSVFSSENEGNRRNTLNLGLGQRYLIEQNRAIAGINLFVDYEGTSKHKRSSLGLEYQRSNFGLTANAYYPLSDKKVIGDYTEEPLAGHDISLSGQMPYAPWATIKGKHYYWNQKVGDNISGNELGVEVELSPSTSIEFGQQDDNTSNKQSYAKLSIKLPFDDNEKATNFALDDKPFRAATMMNLTNLEMVERSKKIKIEKILNNIAPVFTSSSTAIVVENQTSAITLVATDATTVTYSISGTDASLFSVNSGSGVVTFDSAPDYENPGDSDTNNTYVFTATATDSKGLSTTQSVTITVTDISEQGITLSATSGHTTTESGGTATFTIVLDSQPTADVTIGLSSSNTDEGTVSPSSMTFTSSNWNTAQTVTVTGVDDNSDDGDIAYSIVTAAAISSDDNYSELDAADASATNADQHFTFNNLVYAEVVSSYTGKIWLDRNIGAKQVCTARTDSNCYGTRYTWSVANSSCPAGFSIPTKAELQAEVGSNGGITNRDTAFSSPLKIPSAGFKFTTYIMHLGETANLWSSSASNQLFRAEDFYTSWHTVDSRYSMSARCIKD